MKRIISASRRTDIPAFYTNWFMNRIRAGFCHWINPFGGQVYRVSLRPNDCLGIVFWTRDPRPLMPHLRFLTSEGYRFYFHFTINGYPRILEPHRPPVEEAITVFKRLSDAVSPELILWRYDPIVLSTATPATYHLKQFHYLAANLSGYTRSCYFSFVNLYTKTQRNLQKVEERHGLSFYELGPEKQLELARQLQAIAEAYGIKLYSCCNDLLVGAGIQKARCVDRSSLDGPDSQSVCLRPAPTRRGCGCLESVDIGAYNTCVNGCIYCYATNSRKAALKRLRSHDPCDTVLWRPSTLRQLDLIQLERTTASADDSEHLVSVETPVWPQ